jgi:hypothetical protein
MPDKQILCPKCGGEIDAMIVSPWDDPSKPSQSSSIDAAPYVCCCCASLLIALFTNHGPTLLEPDEETIVALQSNQALWQAITTEQARILALPNRPKVRTQ